MIASTCLLPHLVGLDEMVALFPELDLGVFTRVPAVGDDAVIARIFTGDVGGLDGGCNGGEDGRDGG